MSNSKTIETLAEDLQKLLNSPHKCNEENLDKLAEGIKDTLRGYLSHNHENDGNHLRMSNYGSPPRKLWYLLHREEEISPQLRMKFLLGHIIEELVVFLVRETGHTVEHQQRNVEFEGVTGHVDSVIDGVLIDIKGLSPQGIGKFMNDYIFNKDSFNYLPQIKGYQSALKEEEIVSGDEMGFLMLDKIGGGFYVWLMDEVEGPNHYKQVEKAKKIRDMKTPPKQKCYPPVEEDNGNMRLATECTYCPAKKECWEKDANNGEGIRAYQYSQNIKYYVHIKDDSKLRVNELPYEDWK